eukprot:155556_1
MMNQLHYLNKNHQKEKKIQVICSENKFIFLTYPRYYQIYSTTMRCITKTISGTTCQSNIKYNQSKTVGINVSINITTTSKPTVKINIHFAIQHQYFDKS